MKKQRKSSQETILQCWGRVLVPPQGTYITVSLSSSARTKAPTHVEGGNYMLRPQTGWNLKADDWDSWTCYLTTNQSEESHTPWSSHLKSAYKNSSLKPLGDFGSFEHEPPLFLACLQNTRFFAPNSDVSVWLASLCIRHTNLGSTTGIPVSPIALWTYYTFLVWWVKNGISV